MKEAREKKEYTSRESDDRCGPTRNNMPKLKVPGESLKTKNRLKKISKSHKLHVPSKDIQRDTETKKVKRKLNGTVSSATKFYKIFGASEDEVNSL